MVTDPRFTPGEPRFKDPELRQRWYAARRTVREHLLQIISHSPWKSHLVLRGSVLLKTWLGESAREPGDLDWVVVPSTLRKDDPDMDLIPMLVKRVARRTELGTVEILGAGVSVEDLWAYAHAPGQRLVFPWQTTEGLTGTVQLDLAFGEWLPSPPIPFTYTMADGTALELLAASPEQSLAWKLLWLHTEVDPKGKDLYDAVLLAEAFPLSAALLKATLDTPPYRNRFVWESILEWKVDWLGFLREYPNIAEDARVWGAQGAWQERLAEALIPTFAEVQGAGF